MLRCMHFIAAILSLACIAAAEADDHELPNIVIILADDLGFGDLESYNEASMALTPHMDRLAAGGMRFIDAHSPSAVCTPTRYGLLTGRYAWRTRLTDGVLWGYDRSLIESDRMTVASLLQEHGYHTGAVGKWHLGFQTFDTDDADARVDYNEPLLPGPVTVGFDYFYGIPASLDIIPYVWIHNDTVVEAATEEVEGSSHRRQGGGGFWRAGPIAPGFKHIDVHPVITQKSVAYIESRAAEAPEQPFFLYVPLSSPHTPWLPTEDFQGKTNVEPPGGYYTDFVAEVDWTVGQVTEALERADILDDTLLIVTSDNGAHWLQADIERHEHRANGPWRGQKADIHEGGHRVPFIVHWPGTVPAGRVSEQLLCLTDMLATTAAIVRATLPEDAAEDSFNMLPAFTGEDHGKAIRPFAVHHSLDGMFAIRYGYWKLIEGLGSGGFTQPRRITPTEGGPTAQLYNLADDPEEADNLYSDKPEMVEKLQSKLDGIRDSGRSPRL